MKFFIWWLKMFILKSSTSMKHQNLILGLNEMYFTYSELGIMHTILWGWIHVHHLTSNVNLVLQHDRVQDEYFELWYVKLCLNFFIMMGDYIFHLFSCFWHPATKMPGPLISSKKKKNWLNFILGVMEKRVNVPYFKHLVMVTFESLNVLTNLYTI